MAGGSINARYCKTVISSTSVMSASSSTSSRVANQGQALHRDRASDASGQFWCYPDLSGIISATGGDLATIWRPGNRPETYLMLRVGQNCLSCGNLPDHHLWKVTAGRSDHSSVRRP